MILLIDNYDSFTYNLYQYIEELGHSCRVIRNDAITLEGIETMAPAKIVISPGPGDPDSAGVSLATIDKFAGRVPVLGVCLGHQSIGQVFGAKVVRAPRPRHGKLSTIRHDGRGLFLGVENPFQAARYHSLVLARETLPECLEVTAESDDGLVMGVRHKRFAVEGVQFHPESVATDGGRRILENFLSMAGTRND